MSTVTPLAAFADNYIWMLQRPGSRCAAVVDPGDPDPVLEALDPTGLELEVVLVTHHHWDHAGGVETLRSRFPRCRVYGPVDDRIEAITDRVAEGDAVEVPALGLMLRVMEVPGHTSTHIAYVGGGLLFCGDTLFAVGCGRVFDGTFAQLAASLERIAALPGDTLVYCAHEYTLDNLGFAKWVEPDNPRLLRREERERKRRAAGEPTLPSILSEELATNPFLRTDAGPVVQAAERYAGHPLSDRGEVFRVLRQWKDKDYD